MDGARCTLHNDKAIKTAAMPQEQFDGILQALLGLLVP